MDVKTKKDRRTLGELMEDIAPKLTQEELDALVLFSAQGIKLKRTFEQQEQELDALRAQNRQLDQGLAESGAFLAALIHSAGGSLMVYSKTLDALQELGERVGVQCATLPNGGDRMLTLQVDGKSSVPDLQLVKS